ncbi:hypothetical protein D3C83_81720 [compost metagenome]
MSRAVLSIEPPAAAGATISTVRSGRHAACWAWEGAAAPRSTSAEAAARKENENIGILRLPVIRPRPGDGPYCDKGGGAELPADDSTSGGV